MRAEQALSWSQLYLRSLEQSSGSSYESGIQERVQGAVPMKQGADDNPFCLKGLCGCPVYVGVSCTCCSEFGLQSPFRRTCLFLLQERVRKVFVPIVQVEI